MLLLTGESKMKSYLTVLKTASPAIVASGALMGAIHGQHVQPTQSPPPPIATPHQTYVLPVEMESDALIGEVLVHTLDKQVEVRWSFGDASARQFYQEPFDIAYWPTAAARVTDTRLTNGTHVLVAGKRPGVGTTVIERWEFAFPGLPSAETPTVVSKTALFDANVVGKRVVRLMEPVNGVVGKIFVQFHDSDSLFLVDATTGQFTLVGTPATVPMLADDALCAMSGARVGATSYAYFYQSNFAVLDHGVLLCYDNNADGVIDVWQTLANVNAWEAFLDSASFVETYLD
ncbi:MAG: hypothetical protein HOP15_15235 [Planctomycetes bacterium]|nr:hypothetical protein [Planctomycetota bacterium]